MKKITFSLAYKILRTVVSKLSNKSDDQINADIKIESLGFDSKGLIKLTGRIIAAYQDYNLSVTTDEVSDCETINDLILLIWGAIPDDHKQDISPTSFARTTEDNQVLESISNSDAYSEYNHMINEMDITAKLEAESTYYKKISVNPNDVKGKVIYITINF